MTTVGESCRIHPLEARLSQVSRLSPDVEPFGDGPEGFQNDGRYNFSTVRIAATRERKRSSDVFLSRHQLRLPNGAAGIETFDCRSRGESLSAALKGHGDVSRDSLVALFQ